VKRYRSLEERLRLYDEVMRLKGLGLGYKRIARIIEEMYGVRLNPGMICNWVRADTIRSKDVIDSLKGLGWPTLSADGLATARLARTMITTSIVYGSPVRIMSSPRNGADVLLKLSVNRGRTRRDGMIISRGGSSKDPAYYYTAC